MALGDTIDGSRPADGGLVVRGGDGDACIAGTLGVAVAGFADGCIIVEAGATEGASPASVPVITAASVLVVPLAGEGTPPSTAVFLRGRDRAPFGSGDAPTGEELACQLAQLVAASQHARSPDQARAERDAWIERVSHDVRNLITPLSLMLQLLESELERDPARAGALRPALARVTGRLVRLSDSLGDVADPERRPGRRGFSGGEAGFGAGVGSSGTPAAAGGGADAG